MGTDLWAAEFEKREGSLWAGGGAGKVRIVGGS